MKTLRAPNGQEHARGRKIEQRLYDLLVGARDAGSIYTFLQPDALALNPDGKLFLIEAKGQSLFVAPPFDGHGLPLDQLHRYRMIHAATGITTLLIVWDDEHVWRQWIHKLEDGPHFDTKGTSTGKRRIYPVTSFVQDAAGA